MIRRGMLLAGLVVAGPAVADTRGVTIRNGGTETITAIHMAPAGSGKAGDNRLRSSLPVGVEARFGYSSGCRADLRIDYASGRTEDHPDIDTCGDLRVTAGTGGVAGPMTSPATPSARAATKAASAAPIVTPVQAPPPVVPPWTGRSITKRFGGME